MLSFGERLKMARERAGFTQPKVMALTGISDKSISRYENNTTAPDPDTISELCKVYDVSADFIMGFTYKMGKCTIPHESVIANADVHEDLDNLDDESRKKAEEYIEMLKTYEDVKTGAVQVDFRKKA